MKIHTIPIYFYTSSLFGFIFFLILLIFAIKIVIIYSSIRLLLLILFICLINIFILFGFIFNLNLVEFFTCKNQPINSLLFANIRKDAVKFLFNFWLLLFFGIWIIAMNNISFMTFKIIDFRTYFWCRFKTFLLEYLIFLILVAYDICECLIGLLITFLII